MKIIKTVFILSLSVLATNALADDSTKQASKASKHTSLAAAASAKTSTKIASGVIAVPLLATGVSGQATTASGKASLNHASKKPLKITDKIITADPAPNAAMKKQKNEKGNN